MSGPEADGTGGMSAWLRDLGMGARFAVTGGAGSWFRSLFTVVGIALGTGLLLLATAVPGALDAREARGEARVERSVAPYSSWVQGKVLPVDPATAAADAAASRPRPDTLLVGSADTEFRGNEIRGRLLQPDGADAPLPPGLKAFPGPGEMAVSPALADLLSAPGSELLRERLPYKTVATVGDSGLTGPAELVFYAGSDRLTLDVAERVDGFGRPHQPSELGPLLTLLAVTVFVVLLTPVLVFVAVASRFGAAARDRRMAALRLVGADLAMTRRITTGELLATAAAGSVLGIVCFVVGREFVRDVELWDVSAFPADVTPSPGLGLLVVLGIPAAAVAAGLMALRGVTVEPLGVVRRAEPPQGRWWLRLVPALLGLVLLLPMLRGPEEPTESVNIYVLSAGIALLLLGLTALIPGLVRFATARLGGGPVAWLLGVRRLGSGNAASVRVVNGIAVAVAGAIAVQMLLTGMESTFTQATGQRPDLADMRVTVQAGPESVEKLAAVAAAPGVESVVAFSESAATDGTSEKLQHVAVADCAAMFVLAGIADCRPGDVFSVSFAPRPPRGAEPDGYGVPGSPALPGSDAAAGADGGFAPGTAVRLTLPGTENETVPWTVPATVRRTQLAQDVAPLGGSGLYITPEALAGSGYRAMAAAAYVRLVPGYQDSAEQVRTAVAKIDPTANAHALAERSQVRKYTNIKRGLFIGAVVTLLLIAVSMLVAMLEQLREQRRPLAALAAIGTPHRTLALSVLAQAAIPVLAGLALAVAGGVGLGTVLLGVAAHPVAVDWSYVATVAGLGAAAVFTVALLGLPPLWRLVKPENLRTE
ncbi:FtsX-like permease family protein [Yinghuangia soli]|uniref:ABC transporter permease n=1 Tax=Yinghuangia soli TaxID=2908204 RepID=A0AA41PUH2_9ACTN|nr:ABC transporter permease [Yinghuangia soli]MCF2526090.1 ABC transporter permease [Yinghuangia soli]